MVKKGLTTTGKAREIDGWTRYRPFAQEQKGNYVSNFYHHCMQDHSSEFFILLFSKYICRIYMHVFGNLHHSQTFDGHAQFLRLPQQVHQHKAAGFTIVRDVFAF